METAEAPETTTNGNAMGQTGLSDPAEHSPAESQDVQGLFKYSRFVHVGAGAENCPEGEDGSCANPLHFHAWIRLPNQFQHSSIREKALAAKARKLRSIRDPESDERAIIEGELDDIVARDDRESLIEEIANKDFMATHLRAMQDVQGEEDSPYKHIEEDRERMRALEATPEEERNEEELEQLRSHHTAYTEAVNERRNELLRPAREAVEGEPIEQLRSIVFDQRAQQIAHEEFNRTYSIWEWYISTLKPQKQGMPEGKPQLASERVFKDVNHLRAAAPEVIESLEVAFNELEAEAGRAIRGF